MTRETLKTRILRAGLALCALAGFAADVGVQAYPIPDETSSPGPQITVSSNPGELPNRLSGNFNAPWNPGAEPWIKVDFGGPQ
jgi:hypothetical protein